MSEHLSSSILSTGNKFIVTDETNDNTFGSGTTGIISYVKGVDIKCPNVVYLCVVILKRGKHGKQRLDIGTISTPIFNFENMGSSKLMVDEKRKYYVYIEPKVSSVYTIYEMDDLDYLGWALSWTGYLYRLSQFTKPFYVWPSKDTIVGKMVDVHLYWNGAPKETANVFCPNKKREDFIKQMRMLEATLTNCSLSYMSKVSNLEIDALNYLGENNYGKTKIYDKKILNTTFDLFTKKYTNLELLKKRNVLTSKQELTFPF